MQKLRKALKKITSKQSQGSPKGGGSHKTTGQSSQQDNSSVFSSERDENQSDAQISYQSNPYWANLGLISSYLKEKTIAK